MKTSQLSLGLLAGLAAFSVASPAADAASQLEQRDPIICIGCLNTDCPQHSVPEYCNEDTDDIARDCEKACFYVQPGCSCCDINEAGESVNCGPM